MPFTLSLCTKHAPALTLASSFSWPHYPCCFIWMWRNENMETVPLKGFIFCLNFVDVVSVLSAAAAGCCVWDCRHFFCVGTVLPMGQNHRNFCCYTTLKKKTELLCRTTTPIIMKWSRKTTAVAAAKAARGSRPKWWSCPVRRRKTEPFFSWIPLLSRHSIFIHCCCTPRGHNLLARVRPPVPDSLPDRPFDHCIASKPGDGQNLSRRATDFKAPNLCQDRSGSSAGPLYFWLRIMFPWKLEWRYLKQKRRRDMTSWDNAKFQHLPRPFSDFSLFLSSWFRDSWRVWVGWPWS